MTAITLPVPAPTLPERVLLHMAQGVAAHVQARIDRRTERRALALELIRERQTRKADPSALDRELLLIGCRPL